MGLIKKIIVFGLAIYSYYDYAIAGGNIWYFTLGALALFLLFFVFGIKKFWRFLIIILIFFNVLAGMATKPLQSIFLIFLPTIALYFILYRKKATIKVHLISLAGAMVFGEIFAILLSPGSWFGFTAAGAYLFFINLEVLETSETYEILMKHKPDEFELEEFTELEEEV